MASSQSTGGKYSNITFFEQENFDLLAKDMMMKQQNVDRAEQTLQQMELQMQLQLKAAKDQDNKYIADRVIQSQNIINRALRSGADLSKASTLRLLKGQFEEVVDEKVFNSVSALRNKSAQDAELQKKFEKNPELYSDNNYRMYNKAWEDYLKNPEVGAKYGGSRYSDYYDYKKDLMSKEFMQYLKDSGINSEFIEEVETGGYFQAVKKYKGTVNAQRLQQAVNNWIGDKGRHQMQIDAWALYGDGDNLAQVEAFQTQYNDDIETRITSFTDQIANIDLTIKNKQGLTDSEKKYYEAEKTRLREEIGILTENKTAASNIILQDGTVDTQAYKNLYSHYYVGKEFNTLYGLARQDKILIDSNITDAAYKSATFGLKLEELALKKKQEKEEKEKQGLVTTLENTEITEVNIEPLVNREFEILEQSTNSLQELITADGKLLAEHFGVEDYIDTMLANAIAQEREGEPITGLPYLELQAPDGSIIKLDMTKAQNRGIVDRYRNALKGNDGFLDKASGVLYGSYEDTMLGYVYPTSNIRRLQHAEGLNYTDKVFNGFTIDENGEVVSTKISMQDFRKIVDKTKGGKDSKTKVNLNGLSDVEKATYMLNFYNALAQESDRSNHNELLTSSPYTKQEIKLIGMRLQKELGKLVGDSLSNEAIFHQGSSIYSSHLFNGTPGVSVIAPDRSKSKIGIANLSSAVKLPSSVRLNAPKGSKVRELLGYELPSIANASGNLVLEETSPGSRMFAAYEYQDTDYDKDGFKEASRKQVSTEISWEDVARINETATGKKLEYATDIETPYNAYAYEPAEYDLGFYNSSQEKTAEYSSFATEVLAIGAKVLENQGNGVDANTVQNYKFAMELISLYEKGGIGVKIGALDKTYQALIYDSKGNIISSAVNFNKTTTNSTEIVNELAPNSDQYAREMYLVGYLKQVLGVK